MQCEGGEIYYLVAGHLGSDEHARSVFAGPRNALIQAANRRCVAADIDAQRASWKRLANPMRMMKLFAVAHQTGGKDEVLNYLKAFDQCSATSTDPSKPWWP